MRNSRTKVFIAAAALAAVAACAPSSSSTKNDDLRRDLELARGQGLELAPRGAGQSTVSAAELIPQGSHATSSSSSSRQRRTPAIKPAPKGETVAEAPAPTPTPDPTPAAAGPTRPQPSTRPAMNPQPPGGYKSMGELIRKAPFPINP